MIDGKYTSLFFITCACILGFRCDYLHTGMLEETQEEVSGHGPQGGIMVIVLLREHDFMHSLFLASNNLKFGIKRVVKIYNTYT